MRTPRLLLHYAAALTLTTLSGSQLVSAQTSADDISARLKDKPLYLRGFWAEDKLKFNNEGFPDKAYKVVPFTEAGIDVRSVKISGKRLQITGARIGTEFQDRTPQRVEISLDKNGGKITIEVDGGPNADFDRAIDAIFAPDLASLAPMLPSYWQQYATKHLVATGVDADIKGLAGKPVAAHDRALFHIGGGITRPVVLSSVEPEFSEVARKLKYSGKVEVYMWVLEDGSVTHLAIAKPAGLGLDEEAIAAASKYIFRPAMRNGLPVKVDLYFEVNFQIMSK